MKLIDDDEIRLFTNRHLRDEINRNRASKIAGGFTAVKATNFSREFPHYCRTYPEFSELNSALKEVGKIHSRLVEKVQSDIQSKTLVADTLIADLLGRSKDLEISEEVVANAQRRVALGNPPGKQNSLGDALHWESFLAHAGPGGISIVSLDQDFSSALDSNELDDFLTDEFKQRVKFGKPQLFRSLSSFFKSRFPQIVLSVEFEKDELINKLKGSPNFSETHLIIEKLKKYDSFTTGQIRGVFSALVNNNQVAWIAQDDDIQEFYASFEDTAWQIEHSLAEQAAEVLKFKLDFFMPF